jgi:CubicO group peptidase (beta-lactamase class C family)
MALIDTAALQRAIEDLPRRFPGPGGVVAVVKDGVPIERHAWGFANLETHQAFSNTTQMPVCSITKQFTCGTLLSVTADPSELDPLIAAIAAPACGRHTLDRRSGQQPIRPARLLGADRAVRGDARGRLSPG